MVVSGLVAIEGILQCRRYHEEQWPCLYMLALTSQLLIDAAHIGSVARFINHSCEPNCVIQRWQVLGEDRLGVFATRDIAPGDEVTVGNTLSICLAPHALNFTSCRRLPADQS